MDSPVDIQTLIQRMEINTTRTNCVHTSVTSEKGRERQRQRTQEGNKWYHGYHTNYIK